MVSRQPLRRHKEVRAVHRLGPGFQGGTDLRDRIFNTGIIPQESGGRAGVPGQMTQYGRPMGMTQMLPGTARQMAQQLGVPYREDLLSGTSPEAAQYQRHLGQAYWNQGWQATGGDPRAAMMYYYGGPNRHMWGPNTHAYADNVSRRVGL